MTATQLFLTEFYNDLFKTDFTKISNYNLEHWIEQANEEIDKCEPYCGGKCDDWRDLLYELTLELNERRLNWLDEIETREQAWRS